MGSDDDSQAATFQHIHCYLPTALQEGRWELPALHTRRPEDTRRVVKMPRTEPMPLLRFLDAWEDLSTRPLHLDSSIKTSESLSLEFLRDIDRLRRSTCEKQGVKGQRLDGLPVLKDFDCYLAHLGTLIDKVRL